jgi:hypothetical protein
MEIFPKSSVEKPTLTADFTNQMPSSATVVSATVSAVEYKEREDVSASLLTSTTGVVASPYVSFTVQAGQSRLDYLITITATRSNGNVVEQFFLLRVFDQ